MKLRLPRVSLRPPLPAGGGLMRHGGLERSCASLSRTLRRERPKDRSLSTTPDDLKEGKVIDKRLLRVDEAAILLSVSRWTIYHWVQKGRLEATKVGKGSLRIFQASVNALIEQNRTLSGKPVDWRGRRENVAPEACSAGLR